MSVLSFRKRVEAKRHGPQCGFTWLTWRCTLEPGHAGHHAEVFGDGKGWPSVVFGPEQAAPEETGHGE